MISNRILLFITCIISPLLTIGQEFSIKTDYPEVVREGEQFAITWTVNTRDGEFSAPDFTGFYKLMGPQTSYSSSTQIINGKVTRKLRSVMYTIFRHSNRANLSLPGFC